MRFALLVRVSTETQEKKGESQRTQEKHLLVGDIESGPKSDILGQAGKEMGTDRCLGFPASG